MRGIASRVHIPLAVAGSQDIALPDTSPTGLYERLAARGHHVARFVEEIEARQPRAEEAEFLRLTEAQAVLEAARIVSDDGGQAVEAVMNVFSSQEWLPSYDWNASD